VSEVLAELVSLLSLEKIEENLFRGQSQDLGWGRVYGGQVLGQALSAAAQTVDPDRHVHSLHAYFLRPGQVDKPIVYDVDRIRDGGSFTTRRVVAIQDGKAIFHISASFQGWENGFEHQDEMPGGVPAPEELPTDKEIVSEHAAKIPKRILEQRLAPRPFEVRLVSEPKDPISPEPSPPDRMLWFKTVDRLPDDPALHHYLLAYASDYSFMTTALKPHGVAWLTPGMQVASLDHVMWFHQPFRVDEWLLHVVHSPAASSARGLVRGSIYTQDGRLVASTAQEGLIRPRPPIVLPPKD